MYTPVITLLIVIGPLLCIAGSSNKVDQLFWLPQW